MAHEHLHHGHHAHSEAHADTSPASHEGHASTTAFTQHGAVPAVASGHGQLAPSASDLAFGVDGDEEMAHGGLARPTPAAAHQMARLLSVATNGRRPHGHCYRAVKGYIRRAGGYGRIRSVESTLGGDQGEARDFADTVNRNLERFGLERLSMSTPFDAPAGAIVVVAPGSPGTRHPTAGDISIAKGDGYTFYNDGVMHYHGRDAWEGGRGHVLGVYRPK